MEHVLYYVLFSQNRFHFSEVNIYYFTKEKKVDVEKKSRVNIIMSDNFLFCLCFATFILGSAGFVDSKFVIKYLKADHSVLYQAKLPKKSNENQLLFFLLWLFLVMYTVNPPHSHPPLPRGGYTVFTPVNKTTHHLGTFTSGEGKVMTISL